MGFCDEWETPPAAQITSPVITFIWSLPQKGAFSGNIDVLPCGAFHPMGQTRFMIGP